MKLSLSTRVQGLRMVGPSYSKRLEKLGISSVEDLLYHKPHRYVDYSRVTPIRNAQPGATLTVRGTVVESKNVYTRGGKVIQKVVIGDGTGQLEATWFNQPFIPKSVRAGDPIFLAGEIQAKGTKVEFTSPEYELEKKGNPPIHTARLVPVYPETAGVSSKWLRSRIALLVKMILPNLREWLPEPVLREEKLMPLKEALRALHFPKNLKEAEAANSRLAFEEMFLINLRVLNKKQAWKEKKLAAKVKVDREKLAECIRNLPFKLTGAQERTANQILDDLKRPQPMNRLLLGDVGSGKTVVATIAMYATHLSDSRSALMAPTEILAGQHEKTIKNLLAPYKIKVAFCTASRKENLDDYNLLIGTHALLYDRIKKDRFGLVVIDEQHRFGVEQRARLIQKGGAPHTLTMTATPIPRTVALTLYGDLDLSYIDEMPPGRIRVKTWIVPPRKREAAYNWIRKRIRLGEQTFIVCPLIEASEHESMLQVKAASEEYKRLSREVFPDNSMSLLHGRMKAGPKQATIERFRSGKCDILVTTPVVEVGIDIPNATIMMIEGAERFGLAQLHQLRGRVGRGASQSFCLLFTSKPRAGISRLRALETAKTGNELAQLDMKLRGPGEIYGIRQHGFTDLKFASYMDAALIAKTLKAAKEIFKKGRRLTRYPRLANKIHLLEKAVEPN